jgi:hypothetical protein
MEYVVYKRTHRENIRWYIKPFLESQLNDSYILFGGRNAMALACQKALELNEREGKSALAA